MVRDHQVRRLFRLMETEKTFGRAALKSGMDEKTARRYRRLGKVPSEVAAPHTWRTRSDPFKAVWDEVRQLLKINPGLQVKTIFGHLQRTYPGRFADGQLRTLQRRVKAWRATEGPGREVYFPQQHRPGELGESDFTSMNGLCITIGGRPFDHLFYHFVLTYSNWETGTICFSESFESLSEGFQNAVWELGGVPEIHQTDRLSAGAQKARHPEEFTARYKALMRHYRTTMRRTNPSSPHENGDIEQRHNRFKEAVDQSLMLRGNRDFASREEYAAFLREVLVQLNAGRRQRYEEELARLSRLPMKRLEACKRLDNVRVRRSSTIHVAHNTYSVDSRLIGEHVNIRLCAEHVEVWYGQRRVERIPRLRGENGHLINYRHVIDWFVRKPGAFENYRWREEMFPTIRFRMAYDSLKNHHVLSVAAKEYLQLLDLAAKKSEIGVDNALRCLIDGGERISVERVQEILESETALRPVTDVAISAVMLGVYDALLANRMAIVQ
jgi:hypothetical protein